MLDWSQSDADLAGRQVDGEGAGDGRGPRGVRKTGKKTTRMWKRTPQFSVSLHATMCTCGFCVTLLRLCEMSNRLGFSRGDPIDQTHERPGPDADDG